MSINKIKLPLNSQNTLIAVFLSKFHVLHIWQKFINITFAKKHYRIEFYSLHRRLQSSRLQRNCRVRISTKMAQIQLINWVINWGTKYKFNEKLEKILVKATWIWNCKRFIIWSPGLVGVQCILWILCRFVACQLPKLGSFSLSRFCYEILPRGTKFVQNNTMLSDILCIFSLVLHFESRNTLLVGSGNIRKDICCHFCLIGTRTEELCEKEFQSTFNLWN